MKLSELQGTIDMFWSICQESWGVCSFFLRVLTHCMGWEGTHALYGLDTYGPIYEDSTVGWDSHSSEPSQFAFPCPCKLLKTKPFLAGTRLCDPPHLPMSYSETFINLIQKDKPSKAILPPFQLTSLSPFSVSASLTIKLQFILPSYEKLNDLIQGQC